MGQQGRGHVRQHHGEQGDSQAPQLPLLVLGEQGPEVRMKARLELTRLAEVLEVSSFNPSSPSDLTVWESGPVWPAPPEAEPLAGGPSLARSSCLAR